MFHIFLEEVYHILMLGLDLGVNRRHMRLS
jgi:hypothetical protein